MGALVAPVPVNGGFRDNFGDPVARTTRVTDFYLATIGQTIVRSGLGVNTLSTIDVYKSTNGGVSFPTVTSAFAFDARFFFCDKPWMDVKPGADTTTDIIHVTCTLFSSSGTSIIYTRSTNGGATWSAPVTLGTSPFFVQFSQVAVDPGTSNVYVAWEDFASPRSLKIRKSTNDGASFGGTVTIGTLNPVGDGIPLDFLQGIIRAGMDFGGLAVNPANHHVYVCYHEGADTTFDAFGSGGLYRFSDIKLRVSTDGGATWSGPSIINAGHGLTPGSDQFQPGMAVTNSGKIGVVSYDRRNSSGINANMQVFFHTSTDEGATWTTSARTGLFAPTFGGGGEDFLVAFFYNGDYNNPSADKSGVNTANHIAAWGDNSLGTADVRAEKE